RRPARPRRSPPARSTKCERRSWDNLELESCQVDERTSGEEDLYQRESLSFVQRALSRNATPFRSVYVTNHSLKTSEQLGGSRRATARDDRAHPRQVASTESGPQSCLVPRAG